uniref:Palmitoyltransferase n=1 Tax=Compsopogon caeruleus TaxID=31354 RepID=A0A7S1TKR4_9RHOD|mmetsp:Transcript_9289/g.18943  ORF Transcript_9289/g.18943 Transcript_9289/m.18943 type:complete len:205 (+) Transcript_9289:270-884(+)
MSCNSIVDSLSYLCSDRTQRVLWVTLVHGIVLMLWITGVWFETVHYYDADEFWRFVSERNRMRTMSGFDQVGIPRSRAMENLLRTFRLFPMDDMENHVDRNVHHRIQYGLEDPEMSPTRRARRNITVFTLFAVMTMLSYWRTAMSHPGNPDEWKRERPDVTSFSNIERVQSMGGWRFCDDCQKPKPPRTSHCRACKRCIMRMDQ